MQYPSFTTVFPASAAVVPSPIAIRAVLPPRLEFRIVTCVPADCTCTARPFPAFPVNVHPSISTDSASLKNAAALPSVPGVVVHPTAVTAAVLPELNPREQFSTRHPCHVTVPNEVPSFECPPNPAPVGPV